jgi:hypothetical protein
MIKYCQIIVLWTNEYTVGCNYLNIFAPHGAESIHRHTADSIIETAHDHFDMQELTQGMFTFRLEIEV